MEEVETGAGIGSYEENYASRPLAYGSVPHSMFPRPIQLPSFLTHVRQLGEGQFTLVDYD
jgi:hypothetical protein